MPHRSRNDRRVERRWSVSEETKLVLNHPEHGWPTREPLREGRRHLTGTSREADGVPVADCVVPFDPDTARDPVEASYRRRGA